MSSLAPNLAVLAEDALERLGERNSLWFQGEMIKNTTIYGRSRRLQRAFAEMGLGRGDNVCLCMINNPIVYSIFGAGFRSGATVVPVIPQLTPVELRYIFDHTECKSIITDVLFPAATLVAVLAWGYVALNHFAHIVSAV